MEVPPLHVLGRDAVLRSAGMLPALYPGCRSAHVVALRLTTRLPLPGAMGFLPYRGDLFANSIGDILLYAKHRRIYLNRYIKCNYSGIK